MLEILLNLVSVVPEKVATPFIPLFDQNTSLTNIVRCDNIILCLQSQNKNESLFVLIQLLFVREILFPFFFVCTCIGNYNVVGESTALWPFRLQCLLCREYENITSSYPNIFLINLVNIYFLNRYKKNLAYFILF